MPAAKFNIISLPSWIESWAGPIDGKSAHFILYQYVIVAMALSSILVFFFGHSPGIKIGWGVVGLHIVLYIYFYISYKKFSFVDARVIDRSNSMILFWITQFIFYIFIFFVAVITTQKPDLGFQFALSFSVGLTVLTPISARSMRRARAMSGP
jgi:hypothetical protein